MGADTGSPIKALNDLLTRQKAAICCGDISALSSLSGPMGDYLDQLARHPAEESGAAIEKLKRRAEENRHLLGAVMLGVQAGAGRMKEIAGIASELRTYDSRGRQSSVSYVKGQIERRA